MEILGIGFPELVFIFLVAIIIMGPKDMQKAGKTIGKWLRNVVTSDGWRIFQQTSRELRTLPNRLMREANEELEQVNKIGRDLSREIPAEMPETKYSAPAKSKPVAPILTSPPAVKSKADESDPKNDA